MNLVELSPYVFRILPVSPLNSKILAAFAAYLVDSIGRGSGGAGSPASLFSIQAAGRNAHRATRAAAMMCSCR